MRMIKCVVLFVFLFFFTCTSSEIVVKVITEADEFLILPGDRVCKLVGHAHVIYIKCDQKYEFLADEIMLTYGEDKKFKQVSAVSCIVFKYEDLVVSSDRCFFKNDKIVFLGNVLIRNKDIANVRSDSASYDMNTKKIEVTSSSKVVLKIYDEKSIKNDL